MGLFMPPEKGNSYSIFKERDRDKEAQKEYLKKLYFNGFVLSESYYREEIKNGISSVIIIKDGKLIKD